MMMLLAMGAAVAAAPPEEPTVSPTSLLSPMSQAVLAAASVIEVEISLPPAGKLRERWQRGLRVAKVLRVVAPVGEDPPQALKLPDDISPPCSEGLKNKSKVKLLMLIDADSGHPAAFPQVELGWGTNLLPDYPALVDAIVEAKRWYEERMRAVGDEALWQQERKALGSDNLYVRHLAAAFLATHGAAAVVDELWGRPGTPQRHQAEALAALPTRRCR